MIMQQKQKMQKKRSQLLASFLRGVKRYLALGVLATVIATALSYITPLIATFSIDSILGDEPYNLPLFIQNVLEGVKSESKYKALLLMATVLVACTLTGGIFSFFKGKWIAKAGEGMAKTMRDMLYAHLQAVPYSYHTNTQTGDLVQRCTSDVDTVRRFVQMQSLEIARTIFMAAIAAAIMLPINAKMTLISVIMLPFIVVFSFVYFKNVIKHFGVADEAEGALSATIQENLTGVRVVRAFAQERAELDKFTERSKAYKKAILKLNTLMGGYWGLSDSIGYLQITLTLVAGVYFAVNGEMSVGDVILFTTYASMLTFPMRQLGRILADLGKAKVSLGRLEDILNYPVEAEPGKALKSPINGNIEFKNVCFDYGDGVDVLKNVSFSVKEGQTIGILGSTGSGKTSLVQLLQRLHLAKSGEIVIDNVNVNDIERTHLRGNIGIVLQEPFLYSRTIGENIAMARANATEREIHAAAEIACVHDVIQSFEHGYDTIVGERGVTLSGGQKQRVAIARMLLQNTPILIFDDSLSAVDAQTDVAIRNALLKREHGTMFIISHRISTLRNADFIIVLDKGELAQSGTHEQLSAQKGLYRRVCELQSEAVPEGEGGNS